MKKFPQKFRIPILIVAILAVFYIFCLPSKIFNDPYSTVLNDNRGNLLSASIATDGQWRFPVEDNASEKFATALVQTEDKRFYDHLGVDALALARAARQNLKAGKVVSGGSTITMQVIRLSRKNKSRNLWEKFVEAVLATRLEWRYSKKEIIALYAAHAPFGGNVVGLEAACWRFFGRNPADLSWSEAALLAVLPNNPSLIHLGKNRARLAFKRDRLLDLLAQAGKIDTLSLRLAKAEPIPDSPLPLPKLAPHLLSRMIKEGRGQQKINTTLEGSLQQRAAEILDQHHRQLKGNHIYNAAAIIVEVKSGNVVAYVGNTQAGKDNNEDVDVIAAPRSTGSILKPFLFAAMINEGKMLTTTLVPDIPTVINGYAPKNFSKEFDGAVHAHEALTRSLNVPAIYELREYRYEKFYDELTHVGITTLNHPADHYGLTLVLGGAEATLWDVTSAYASMARTLTGFSSRTGNLRYDKNDFHTAHVEREAETPALDRSSWLSAASIYETFDVMKEVHRPGEASGWKYFSSTKKIAWKTGTSFGFRDGWAVGVTPDYAVGVWVGNADGEGRPGLTGTETAAPILFDLFSTLPGNAWFQIPYSEMSQVAVCSQSGQRASSLCEHVDTTWVANAGLQTPLCSFHKKVFLTADKKFRVHANCESLAKAIEVSWFVLPPIQEYYFKSKSFNYKSLPPYRRDCENPSAVVLMDLIYPKSDSRVFVPRELNGEMGKTVFEAVHRNTKINVYWHLDGTYVGRTTRLHRLALSPPPGTHLLTLVDDNGETISRSFKVISGSE